MNRILTAMAALLLAGGSVRADVDFLWGVNFVKGSTESTLYAINPKTGKVYGAVGKTGAVNLSGLAVQPGTGALLAVQGQLNPTAGTAKKLYRLNKATAAATLVGALGAQYAISDLAMRGDGTLFGFGVNGSVKKLLTVNAGTGAVTETMTTNNFTDVSLAFSSAGVLYLVRVNGLYSMNQTTGAFITGPMALSGATTTLSNFMATDAAGVIHGGLRSGGGTQLFRLDPVTGVTTLVSTIPGIQLMGMVFDRAKSPALKISGKSRVKTKKAKYSVKGTASATLPMTVKIKGATKTVTNGKWTVPVKLKVGKNAITVTGQDLAGQRKTAKITIVRVK